MRALLDCPDTFQIRYHRHHTGITSWAFGRGRIREDAPAGSGAAGTALRSSYDVLADLVPVDSSAAVLDLGCGDGLLMERLLARGVRIERMVGIDMSPDELSMARKRPGVDRVALHCEKASAMSLGQGSVGHVLCHLSFERMSEIDGVVAEIARVLVPGGLFSAVLQREAELRDAAAIFDRLFDELYQSQATHAPVLGDPRALTTTGLRELLRPERHLGGLEIVDFELCLDGTPIEVWNCLSARYEAYMVLPRHRADLRVRFTERVRALARPDGTIPCALPLRHVSCRRTGAAARS